MAGQRIAAFAWQMLGQSSTPNADASGSFLSPVSLYIALGLALNGAGSGSDTEQQIFHLLHQDKARLLGLLAPKTAAAADVQQLTTELAALSSSLVQQQQQQQGDKEDGSKAEGGAQLIIANGVWTKGVPVHEAYAAKMLQLFKAEVREVASVDPINAWAAAATKGLINVAVPPGTDFDLVLTNAVYFKGLWEYAFKKEATSRQAFKLGAGDEVQVDMMSKRFKAADQSAPGARKVQYAETSSYQAVRLPYKGSTISALIVLPSEHLAAQGIAAAAAQLDVGDLLDATKFRNVGPAGLDVQLPKFKVKTQPTSLKKELVSLGLSAPFADKAADFSQLSPQPLYISDVLQSVCVIVDEEGTEAAAVTAVIMMRATAVMAATPLIRFDRPFLFMLVDDASSTPLFVGTVSDPSNFPQ
ncbi:hypothetical protein OEZ85_002593 [Tetradesmus obliquus]|uniref:Serpin domain-containing protein n=1 Tax=Tetradesmus obliquus TaxID=3088 RepID=A0ABY8TY57_TETOB|nr:hypothetical protein OEZ85_002593 [Tetradesmus obliquus]